MSSVEERDYLGVPDAGVAAALPDAGRESCRAWRSSSGR